MTLAGTKGLDSSQDYFTAFLFAFISVHDYNDILKSFARTAFRAVSYFPFVFTDKGITTKWVFTRGCLLFALSCSAGTRSFIILPRLEKNSNGAKKQPFALTRYNIYPSAFSLCLFCLSFTLRCYTNVFRSVSFRS